MLLGVGLLSFPVPKSESEFSEDVDDDRDLGNLEECRVSLFFLCLDSLCFDLGYDWELLRHLRHWYSTASVCVAISMFIEQTGILFRN